jgi:hypothetical protein
MTPASFDPLTSKLQERLKVWRADLPTFARDCLKILDKNGRLVPLVFNEAQTRFHEAIEQQRAETGMVRMTVLKGRRQGISTYVAARYYWRASLSFGRKVYILSHERNSSDALFGMVERFHKYNPFAPEIGENNARKMTFPNLEGSYTVATAGNQEGGRGDDINLLHGSEAAFWQNAESHFAASMQCVALLPGTEIILESTSGGPSGKFFETFRQGEQRNGIYRSVFIPWFIQPEYALRCDDGFALSDETPDDNSPSEAEVAAAYKLTNEQMHWRRIKVAELGLPRFNREYPSCAEDAWASTETDHFILPAAVLRARGRKTEPSGPLIIGVDPAGGGGDRFAVAWRRGNAVTKIEWRNKINTLEATQWLLDILERDKPDRMNIDSGNIGQAIITNLRSMRPDITAPVRSVAFGSPSQAKMASRARVGPENRRAEMWGRLKEWIEDAECYAAIPDIDDLCADLVAPKPIHRTNGDWLLMSKADMRKNGIRSPDLGDAVALTFASKEYFAPRDEVKTPIGLQGIAQPPSKRYEAPVSSHGGGWMI